MLVESHLQLKKPEEPSLPAMAFFHKIWDAVKKDFMKIDGNTQQWDNPENYVCLSTKNKKKNKNNWSP